MALDLIVNVHPQAAAQPVLSAKSTTLSGAPPLLTAGDGWDDASPIELRLWLYDGRPGASASTNVRRTPANLAIAFKSSRKSTSPELLRVSDFTEITDANGHYGYSARLNLNTVGLLAATASGEPVQLWCDISDKSEPTVQFAATVRPQTDSGGAEPTDANPPYPLASQLALKSDLDVLRGGVPQANAWENPMDSAFFEVGNVTIPDGIPAALYGTGPINFVANALPAWKPATIDISGVLLPGTATNCTAFFTFLGAAGGELLPGGGRSAVFIPSPGNADFSIASLPVPSGATRLAFGYMVIDSQQPCEFSAGFASIAVTANANLSELTADALAAILAEKAQAEADAAAADQARIAAEADAAAADQARIDALADASGADAARIAAEASAADAMTAKESADVYAAGAYNAMLNAGNSNKVATDDWRLGLRGGVAHTASGFTLPVGSTSGWRTVLASFGSGVLGVAGQTTELFRAGTLYQDGSLLVASRNDTGRLTVAEGTSGGPYSHSTTDIIPAGATTCAVTYNATANTISIWFDGVISATYTRQSSLALASLYESSKSAGGRVQRAFAVFNFELSGDQQRAAMRGEYPQAWIGGATITAQSSTAWTDNGYTPTGTIDQTTPGTLIASHLGGGSNASALKLDLTISGNSCPQLRIGRTVRVTLTAASVTGSVPVSLRDSAGTLLATATTVTTDGAKTLDFALTAAGNGSLVLCLGDTAAHAATLSALSIAVLGAQLLVGPSDWTRTRGVDMSGNCNDLVYGAGVVAIEPATKTRVIAATAAGATVSAGSVATVGTLSGATYRDTKALAAMRPWDAVSANWRQTRPANCAALQAAVATAGAPTVEATAITGNAVIAANAALNLTHHIN